MCVCLLLTFEHSSDFAILKTANNFRGIFVSLIGSFKSKIMYDQCLFIQQHARFRLSITIPGKRCLLQILHIYTSTFVYSVVFI